MSYNCNFSNINNNNENILEQTFLNGNKNNENNKDKNKINKDCLKNIDFNKSINYMNDNSFTNDKKNIDKICIQNKFNHYPKDNNNEDNGKNVNNILYIHSSYNNNSLSNNNLSNSKSIKNSSNNHFSNINFLKDCGTQEKKNLQNKRNRNTSNKKRNDNILKQVKVHTILFIIQTLNELLKIPKEIGIINKFLEFSREIKKEFKEKIEKSYNLENFEKTIKEILYKYYQNEIQKKDLNTIEDIIKKGEHKNFKIIEKFLNLKFKELIQIYGMSNEEFKEKFRFENKYLLINNNSKSILGNKNDMFDLISKNPVNYLKGKNKRENNKNNKFIK